MLPAALLHIETILPIYIEMGILRQPNIREIGLLWGIVFLLELLRRRGHIHGIPHDDGIGDQIQAN